MRTVKQFFTHLLEQAIFLFPAAVGGLVDYLNQLLQNSAPWHWGQFFVHMISAIFFGWMVGTLVSGFDYPGSVVAAAGGMGGFLGVRVADLLRYLMARGKG